MTKNSKSPRSATQVLANAGPSGPVTDSGDKIAGFKMEDAAIQCRASFSVLQNAHLHFISTCVVYLFSATYGNPKVTSATAFETVEGWIAEQGVKRTQVFELIATARGATQHLIQKHKLGGIVGQILDSATAADANTLLLNYFKQIGGTSYNQLRIALGQEQKYTSEAMKADATAAANKTKPGFKAAQTKKRNANERNKAVELVTKHPEVIADAVVRAAQESDTNLASMLATVVERIGTIEECDMMAEAIAKRRVFLTQNPHVMAAHNMGVAPSQTRN